MDEKYTISDKYKINEDIKVSGGKLYIPAKEGAAYSYLVCDSQKVSFQIPVSKEVGKDGTSYFVADFFGETGLADDIASLFTEKRGAISLFPVYLLDGLECHKIKTKRKKNLFVRNLISAETDGAVASLSVYFSQNGNMNFLLSEKQDMYRKNVDVYLESVRQKGNICEVVCYTKSLAMVSECRGEFVGLALVSACGGQKYPVLPEQVWLEQGTGRPKAKISAKIDFSKIHGLFSTHWNLLAVILVDGEEYTIPVRHGKRNKKLRNTVLKEGLKHSYPERGGRGAAYLDITKAGNIRVYTGDFNNAAEYAEETLNSFIQNPKMPFSKEISVKVLESGMGYLKVQLMEASLQQVEELALMVYQMPSVEVLAVPAEIVDREAGIWKVDTSAFSQVCKGTGAAAFKLALAVRMGSRFMKGRLIDREIYTETMIGRYGVADGEIQPEDGSSSDDTQDDSLDDAQDDSQNHVQDSSLDDMQEDGRDGMQRDSQWDGQDNMQDEHAVYMDNFFSMQFGDDVIDACPYTNHTGFFMMRMCKRSNMSIYKIVCEALRLCVSGKYLSVEAKCPGEDREWAGFLLSYRYRKEEDRDERFFAAGSVIRREGCCVMSVDIPLEGQNFKSIYWNIRPVFMENGEECYAAIKALKPELKESYKKLFQHNCKYYQVGDEKYILFPFVAKNGNITLMYRTATENDGIKFRIKERLGLRLYQLWKKKLDRKRIMLVYEKYCYMAEDNGYQFFKYCMEHDMEHVLKRKIYYVIDKNSPDYQKVKKYKKNVLGFMSVKFIAYMLAAKLLVSSDVRSHAYAFRHRSSIIAHVIRKKKHVFLQHGVTAMKKVDNIFGKSNNLPTNLFIVTSDEEYSIVSKYFGYNKNEIALAGFARWDVLEDRSAGRREILLMPTWRNWLDDVDGDTFKDSDYFKNYMQLLNSQRLGQILAKYDVHMNFYIHPKFKDYIGHFRLAQDRIRLVPFGTEPLNELMMQCNMLITDYSSVSWDVYYMKKPVIFYQFDIDTYLETHGSYMDMEHDLFGDRTLYLDELIDLIEENIQNGFRLKPRFEAERPNHFKYIDQNNCQRICEAIEQRGY